MPPKKAHPEKVNPVWARNALHAAKDAQSAYSQYILNSYHATGNLASGCDARDLIAWYEINMAEELAAKSKKAGKK